MDVTAGPEHIALLFRAEIPTEVFLDSRIMIPSGTGNVRPMRFGLGSFLWPSADAAGNHLILICRLNHTGEIWEVEQVHDHRSILKFDGMDLSQYDIW